MRRSLAYAAARNLPRASRTPPPSLKEYYLLLKSKDAHFLSAMREKDARLADKDALIASAAREMDARLADKEELLKEVRQAAAKSISAAKHEADVAKGIVNARGLFEAILADIYRMLDRMGRTLGDGTVTARFERLFNGGCPELMAYLDKTADDNGVPKAAARAQARKLYAMLSDSVHSEAAGRDSIVSLPVEVFAESRRARLLAFAALARFAERDLRLYKLGDGCVEVVSFVLAEPVLPMPRTA